VEPLLGGAGMPLEQVEPPLHQPSATGRVTRGVDVLGIPA
jgi:hypothetical protein